MHHGTVLGDADQKPVPQNNPVMHRQRRYSQTSSATSEWRIWILKSNVSRVGPPSTNQPTNQQTNQPTNQPTKHAI